MSRRRHFILLSSIIALGAACVVGSLSYAAGKIAPGPTPIASVDIQQVLDRLVERGEMEAAMQALTGRLEDEVAKRGEAFQAQAREADAVTEPVERQARRDGVAMEQLRLKQWVTLRRSELDREYALRWEGLYRAILSATRELAESEGYAYVIVDDGEAPMTRDPRAQQPLTRQITEQIMRRRILYAATAEDVTEELILRMNNNRTGSSTAAPAGSSAPASTPPATP